MWNPIAQLLSRHDEMEDSFTDVDAGNFLFGWQCENPFAESMLEATRQRENNIDHIKYVYVEDDENLAIDIRKLHDSLDGLSPEGIFCAPGGAVSILFTFSAFLHNMGIREVYYIPPLYYTMYFAFKLFGIRVRAVSGLHAIEPGFSMNLPKKDTILILTDPVWYAGCVVPETIVEAVIDWQRRTGSLVFVDGSFQYMRWNRETIEASSRLAPNRTFRLICPTKLLGIHGYRFAYTLLPEETRPRFTTAYTNIYGSTSAANWAFAHEAVAAVKSRAITNCLVNRAEARHKGMRAQGKIASVFQPECGYFTFEQINVSMPKEHLMMTGEYFDQPRYPGYSRLNLLSPSFSLLAPLGCE